MARRGHHKSLLSEVLGSNLLIPPSHLYLIFSYIIIVILCDMTNCILCTKKKNQLHLEIMKNLKWCACKPCLKKNNRINNFYLHSQFSTIIT